IVDAIEGSETAGDDVAGISASIGISTCPADGVETDLLLERAEVAMHHARARGRTKVHFYTPSIEAEVERTLGIETILRTAIRTGVGLVVHYQPKVDVPSDAV